MFDFRVAKQSLISFGASTIVSRAATLCLIPLFTFSMSVVQYGEYELMLATNAFLVPLYSMMLHEIVLKNCLASKNRFEYSAILTNAVVFILIAFLFIFSFIAALIYANIMPASSIIYPAIAASLITIYELFGKFCKGLNNNDKFLMGNIILASSLLLSNAIFLIILKLNLIGAILAYLLSYAVANLYLFISAKIFSYIDLHKIDMNIIISMLKQSMPLVPNALLWWGINLSDRFILAYFDGRLELGHYAFASKIASIILVIQGILFQVWQLIVYRDDVSRNLLVAYFSFYAQTMIFFGALFTICFSSFLHLLVNDEFRQAINYSFPIMVSIVFFGMASALGVLYVFNNNTIGALKTTIIAAVINIILNFFAIPKFGIYGAITATVISTAILFIIRFYQYRHLFIGVLNFLNVFSFFLFVVIIYLVGHGAHFLLLLVIFLFLAIFVSKSYNAIRRSNL